MIVTKNEKGHILLFVLVLLMILSSLVFMAHFDAQLCYQSVNSGIQQALIKTLISSSSTG